MMYGAVTGRACGHVHLAQALAIRDPCTNVSDGLQTASHATHAGWYPHPSPW